VCGRHRQSRCSASPFPCTPTPSAQRACWRARQWQRTVRLSHAGDWLIPEVDNFSQFETSGKGRMEVVSNRSCATKTSLTNTHGAHAMRITTRSHTHTNKCALVIAHQLIPACSFVSTTTLAADNALPTHDPVHSVATHTHTPDHCTHTTRECRGQPRPSVSQPQNTRVS
jgi:hypothetical protein